MRSTLRSQLCILGCCLLQSIALAQPLDFSYEKRHIYVSSTINGKEARLIFDSGSSYVCLDSTFLVESGLSYAQRGKAMMKGSGNGMQTADIIFSGVSVSLGGKTFQPEPVPVFDLRAILKNPADGIFGMGDVKDKVISIDYPNRKIAFLDELAPGMTDGYTQVPIEYDPSQPWRAMFPLEVVLTSGTVISGQGVIDTGAGQGIEFTSKAAAKYHLDQLEDRKAYQMEVGGVGGAAAGYDFAISEARIGGVTIPLTEAGYSTNESGALASDAYIALVGNDVWVHLAIILDLKAKKLYLRRDSPVGAGE